MPSFGRIVTRAEQIIKQVGPDVSHADLPGVAGGIAHRQVTPDLAAPVDGLCPCAVEGQRKAPQHRRDNPAGVTFRQQEARCFALFLADRAVMHFDFIDHHPGDGVSVRGHGVSFWWLCATRPAFAGHGRVKVARTAYRGAVSRTGRLTENRSPGIYILRSESKTTQEHLSASISGIPALGNAHPSLLNFGRGRTPPAFSAAGVV